MLAIEGLRQRLGDLELDISAEIATGRRLALVGRSGAGKTSLLRCVAGLRNPDAGRIECNGKVWADAGAGRFMPPEQRRCGYLFQDYALFPHLSAWRNVEFGIARPAAERRRRALELLDRFGLAGRADAKPATLSGGERQRVALARALAVDPAALLFDEPLGALDASTRGSATRELAGAIEAAGVPALVVTHDFEEAALLADEIGVLAGGRIVQRGSPSELAAAPGSAFVADLIGSVVISGQAGAPDSAGTPIRLEGGSTIWTAGECAPGGVSVSVHPWEILLEPIAANAAGSARNRVAGRVTSITPLGGRVRVGLDAGQPLAAEVTPQAVAELDLAPGREVVAVWKASATRVVEISQGEASEGSRMAGGVRG